MILKQSKHPNDFWMILSDFTERKQKFSLFDFYIKGYSIKVLIYVLLQMGALKFT